MDSISAFDQKRAPVASDDAPPNEAGLLESAVALWRDLQGLAHDRLALAALETRQAGKSLVSMIVAGLMVAALLVSAWLGLMGVAVLWLVTIGVAPTIALLFAVAANLALALVLRERIRQHSRNLQFPRSVRALEPAPANIRESEIP